MLDPYFYSRYSNSKVSVKKTSASESEEVLTDRDTSTYTDRRGKWRLSSYRQDDVSNGGDSKTSGTLTTHKRHTNTTLLSLRPLPPCCRYRADTTMVYGMPGLAVVVIQSLAVELGVGSVVLLPWIPSARSCAAGPGLASS